MKEKYSDGIEWNTYEKLRKERPELFAESTQIPIVTDKETVDTFVRETGQKVGVMYSSEYHYLLVDLIRNPDGKLYTYERILPVVPSGAAVAVTIQNGLFVLLRQYRPRFERVSIFFHVDLEKRNSHRTKMSKRKCTKKSVRRLSNVNIWERLSQTVDF